MLSARVKKTRKRRIERLSLKAKSRLIEEFTTVCNQSVNNFFIEVTINNHSRVRSGKSGNQE